MDFRHPLFALVVVLGGAGLSACVSSGGADVVKPMASDRAASSFVGKIVLTSLPDDVDQDFAATFTTVAGERLRACAKGANPLRLEVAIIEFHPQNAAHTLLIGDSNTIRGSARLVDPASGEVVGDYDINRSTGGGGLIAAAAMSGGSAKMAAAFADELCKRAFVAR